MAETVALDPVGLPPATRLVEGDQLYELKLPTVAPLTAVLAELPLQKVAVLVVMLKAGGAVTVARTDVRAVSQTMLNFIL